MSDDSNLEAEILEVCRKLIHPSVELETKLIEEGLLDSFHTLKLATHLEDTYGITVELSELSEADVGDVRSIAALVARLRPAG